MSAQNHYETLGVDESSSFDEIQNARDKLLKEFAENRKQAEAVEAAYDAILMNRLRLRQEGKIKVPDRIRFAEKLVETPPQNSSSAARKLPEWVNRLIDNPSRNEVLWPAAIFSGAAFLSVLTVSAGLAVGFIASLFFLNRKEKKFLRALLLTLFALTVGVTLGSMVGALVEPQLRAISIDPLAFAGIVASFFFWLVSSFFR